MAKYIATKCQICGSDMVLVQPAIKPGDTKSVARGECMQCQECLASAKSGPMEVKS